MKRVGLAAVVLAACFAATMSGQQAGGAAELRWWKGNTHTHTLNSDGDSAPDEVVRWYREQGYHFVVLTDHNFVTPVEGLNALFGAEGRFLVMSGDEVTDRADKLPVHVNAVGATKAVGPHGGKTARDVLLADVEAVRAAGAVPQVNHPNFGWALNASDLAAVQGVSLLEIFNGHPQVNNVGGGGSAGVEAMWDAALTAGATLFAVASDDTHHLKRPWAAGAARPGRGWVMVRSSRLSSDEILAALSRGDFYASTGVELLDLSKGSGRLSVAVRQQGGTKYTIQFIGRGGRVLAEATTSPATYEFEGGEGFVRARVSDSNGLMAWTQPVPVK
ncbi:MAG: CehA/McbA family metallohydrolase [Vicinamibacterales bacterium]